MEGMVFSSFSLQETWEYWGSCYSISLRMEVGWKLDEKLYALQALAACSPGGDGGLTPQPEIASSHKMFCLFPAQGVRDRGVGMQP